MDQKYLLSVVKIYANILEKQYGSKIQSEYMERFAFYEGAKKAFLIVHTGETYYIKKASCWIALLIILAQQYKGTHSTVRFNYSVEVSYKIDAIIIIKKCTELECKLPIQYELIQEH